MKIRLDSRLILVHIKINLVSTMTKVCKHKYILFILIVYEKPQMFIQLVYFLLNFAKTTNS